MARIEHRSTRWWGKVLVVGVLMAGLSISVWAHEKKAVGDVTQPAMSSKEKPASEQASGQPGQMMAGSTMSMPGAQNMRMPQMNSERGRKLFVEKGCVSCHSINGVGGHDATALDAHTMAPMMHPFEFAAKMWRMAPAMIYAQEEALGEQIVFSGDELADIIAFVHDDEEQHKLTEAAIPPRIRKMMNHSHGEPGGGPKAHGKELGHPHHKGGHGGMMHSQ